MGLFGGIKGAAKGLAGGPAEFEAVARRGLEFPREQVFEAGTRVETIPRRGNNLTLDFGEVATGATLYHSQEIGAQIDLSSLGKLSDALAVRIGRRDVVVPMVIERLDTDMVRLTGIIKRLGTCSLEIALREDVYTCADVVLGVSVEPPDIRTIAELQRSSLEQLLAESVDGFSDEYVDNIRKHLA